VSFEGETPKIPARKTPILGDVIGRGSDPNQVSTFKEININDEIISLVKMRMTSIPLPLWPSPKGLSVHNAARVGLTVWYNSDILEALRRYQYHLFRCPL
jgi:hypothetical protein